ncbi:hypothetical protein BD413DRAFT_607684 [Trametes elegans]|nr:hypothetical protein BD413DRAFT_607684 [Trametes elegans]
MGLILPYVGSSTERWNTLEDSFHDFRQALGPHLELQTERTFGPPSTGGNASDSLYQRRVWGRRYTRASQPDSRVEEGAPPLNGRFARHGAFGQHYPADMVWVDVSSWGHSPVRRRTMGDYMRDEDFDVSYEGLISLSTVLGDAKPRGTPGDVLASLPRARYSEWADPGATDDMCPICLDNYQPADDCLRIPHCSHWFHEGCIQQWLKTARTCPVCRGRVVRPPSANEAPAPPAAGPSGLHRHRTDRDEDDEDGLDPSEAVRARIRRMGRLRAQLGRPPWRHREGP